MSVCMHFIKVHSFIYTYILFIFISIVNTNSKDAEKDFYLFIFSNILNLIFSFKLMF